MDTCVYMSIMAARIVKGLGIIHMVFRTKNYKTASSIIIRALGGLLIFLSKLELFNATWFFLLWTLTTTTSY